MRLTITLIFHLLAACLGAMACLPAASNAQSASGEGLFLTVADSLPMPPGLIRGLAWLPDGTVAVLHEIPADISERGRRRVLLSYLNGSGQVVSEENFTGTLDEGLASDGEFLWSCGADPEGGALLYKIIPGTGDVEGAFPLSGHRPTGVAWDGEDLWVVDRDSGRLDRFDPEEGQVTRSVLTPGFSPHGLAHVGGHTWVSDQGTGRLYRLAGARRRWSGTVDADTFSHRGEEVVLGSDGSSLWIVMPTAGKAYLVRIH